MCTARKRASTICKPPPPNVESWLEGPTHGRSSAERCTQKRHGYAAQGPAGRRASPSPGMGARAKVNLLPARCRRFKGTDDIDSGTRQRAALLFLKNLDHSGPSTSLISRPGGVLVAGSEARSSSCPRQGRRSFDENVVLLISVPACANTIAAIGRRCGPECHPHHQGVGGTFSSAQALSVCWLRPHLIE